MRFKEYKVLEIKKYVNELDLTSDITNILEELRVDERESVKQIAISLERKYFSHKEKEEQNQRFYEFDREYILNNNFVIAGCDEVGRGPLAGPIVCASVILDLFNDSRMIRGINDSKKLKNHEFKKELSETIKQTAIDFKIIEISNDEIDNIGIGEANQMGFRNSINQLNQKIDLILSDGYLVKEINKKNVSIIKGDTKSATIMCASIIAKVYRDELMFRYHEEFPQYDFVNNVGYGTQKHIEAIKKFGICKYHRKSFLKNYL